MTRPVFPDTNQYARHNIFPGVSIRTAAGNGMMISDVSIAPNAIVELHSHPHEQVGMVLEGRATFYVGTEEKNVGPGEMYFIPGGVEHKVVASAEGCRAIDIFTPIREDYL